MMKPLILVFLAFTISAYAQDLSYDTFPDAAPPYYRVSYDASTKPGELVFPVSYTIWIPSDVDTLRGVIVHQHGCGMGACITGRAAAFDLHWQALAKKNKCALLGPSYEQPDGAECISWCDPRSGSAQRFLMSLEDLGALSGHHELATVPWALWGHSGGGAWVGFMTMLYPNRVAAVWMNSGIPTITPVPTQSEVKVVNVPNEAFQIPMMCNLGTQEGVTVKDGHHGKRWASTELFFNTMRSKGGLIGLAVDPLTSHPCGNQRYLAIPWFDACLDARLPNTTGNSLRSIEEGQAWLAPLLGNKATPFSQYVGNKDKAVWLPNESVTKAWEHYVRDTEIPDLTPPPAPFNIRLVNKTLTWDAEADLESGIAHFIIVRDGKEIATVADELGNPLSRSVFQGMRNGDTPLEPLNKMQFTDTLTVFGHKYKYGVMSVNTVGLRSDLSINDAEN
jgi:pimeloyl-ACP methyl ester carboxylesterase